MSEATQNVLMTTAKAVSPTRQPTNTFVRVAARGIIVWVLIGLIVICRFLYPGFLAQRTSSTS